MTSTATTVGARRYVSPAGLFALAWIIASLEGFDLAVYGVSVPALLKDQSLGIDPAAAGTIGSMVGFGMLIGAAFAGSVVHRTGPKKLIIWSIATFSVGMLMSFFAPSALVWAISRFVVGLGLGVVLPTLNAYVADLAHPTKRNQMVASVMSGYAIGALASPLLGSLLVPTGQFRWLYIIGILPVAVLIPFFTRMPDSPGFLREVGRTAEAEAIEAHYGLPAEKHSELGGEGRGFGLAKLLAPGARGATLLFWLMSFCGLLLVFGISTWLPTMMQKVGYSLGNALLQTAMMWLGVFVGVLVGGKAADKFGPKPVVIIAFLVGTFGLIAMSMNPNVVILYGLMFISGLGFIGSQMLVNAFIVSRYPHHLRGTGIAWALTIGRLGAILGPSLGAWVVGSGLGTAWNFYIFAIPALIGAIATALVPRITVKNEWAADDRAAGITN